MKKYFLIGCILGLGIILIMVVSANQRRSSRISETMPKVEEKQVAVSYDLLQQIFLADPSTINIPAVEKVITDNNLKYTRNVWMSTERTVTYKIAYTQNDAMQRYGTDGDSIEITFGESKGDLITVKYWNWEHYADVHYFPTSFSDGGKIYSGYVYHDYDKPKFSNYYQCSSGKDAMTRLLQHSR